MVLRPMRKWNGKDRSFRFVIGGKSDSDGGTCPTTRRSVTGYSVFLEAVAIMVRSVLQRIQTLSVTESELLAVILCVQDMLYACHILEGLELKVEKPMILECDNKGAVDLINNWSTGGRTRHIQSRIYFLRQLKEQNELKVIWKQGENNC